jgi:hypothetical protein
MDGTPSLSEGAWDEPSLSRLKGLRIMEGTPSISEAQYVRDQGPSQ